MTYEIKARKDGMFDLYVLDINGDVHTRKTYKTEKGAIRAFSKASF